MIFLIQTIDDEVVHDFSKELIESINFNKWLVSGNEIKVEFLDNWEITDGFHETKKEHVPIGSVEFVSAFITQFHGKTPKPRNIPKELLDIEFTHRKVINGTEKDVKGYKFVKSNDKIKDFTELRNFDDFDIKKGNYQISEEIDIESEYRCFVYRGELVGMKHYSGDFTIFPQVSSIFKMIDAFKDAPIAYTLDVGIGVGRGFESRTFIVEVHDFFSCGLYGFSDGKRLPHMFAKWYYEYIGLLLKV